jgi:hypothetical protein
MSHIVTRSQDQPNVEPDTNAPNAPNEPRNLETGLAWRLMNTADENSEKMPEQIYLDLANLSADVAKLERKEERLRKYVIENEGEDCEALMPSDDDEMNDEDFHADSDEDDEFPSAFSCTSSNPCLGAHVHSSHCGSVSLRGHQVVSRNYEDVENASKDAISNSATPSGLYIKHKDTYYCIPQSAVMRCMNECIEVPDIETFDELTRPGHRAFYWDQERHLLNPASIVVLRMKRRFTKKESVNGRKGKYDFYWGVFLTLQDSTRETHDHRIVHLLPETTIFNLFHDLKACDDGKTSSLCNEWAPSFVFSSDFSPCFRWRENPIPGRNKRYIDTHGPNTTQLRGNYWPEVSNSKRARMTTNFVMRGYVQG